MLTTDEDQGGSDQAVAVTRNQPSSTIRQEQTERKNKGQVTQDSLGLKGRGFPSPPQIKEVWFSGTHSDMYVFPLHT